MYANFLFFLTHFLDRAYETRISGELADKVLYGCMAVAGAKRAKFGFIKGREFNLHSPSAVFGFRTHTNFLLTPTHTGVLKGPAFSFYSCLVSQTFIGVEPRFAQV